MSRHTNRPRTSLKLPFALEKELGLDGRQQSGSGRRHQYGSVTSRKEQRKAERHGRRQHVRGPQVAAERTSSPNELDGEDEDDILRKPKTANTAQAWKDGRNEDPKPKSILKKPKQPSPTPSEAPTLPVSRSLSPGLVLDGNSQAFKDRAAQDDAEITALEKKLGVKKNMVSKSFAEDGLDDLLEGLDEEDRGVKRKTEGKEWLERKRRKATIEEDEEGEKDEVDLDEDDEEGSEFMINEDGASEGFLDGELDEDFENGFSDGDTDHDAENSFEGFESEEGASHMQPKKVRENPYVPPVAPSASTGKYIPPSLRKAQNSEGASLARLKRQLQGHLNKLSEANLVSILGEVEKVYQSNPRQDVTSVLIDLLLTLFCNKSALQNTFVILHAAFATAVYKVIGVDFGAELLSQLVDRFDHYHGNDAAGKEAVNLISLLSNLFTFHMVSTAVVFDHIRLLLERLSENNTELLLRLVRDCGPQLRQDDPSSLKAIVQLILKETARMNSAGEQISVRTKFMIEIITDLRNNKMKATTNNAGLASEHITLMRKVLGSLNDKRTVRASEPLRITREDIRNSDKKGKWWLVGASWKGNEPTAGPEETTDISIPASGQVVDDDSIDLLALSRQHGMNTDVRRSIFITLLSAVDYQDAHMRLFKLRLKRTQEQEVPRVLLRCAGGEKPYNQYYTLVAKKLCLDKRMRKAFQFALWGFFRRLGENPDLDDEEEEFEDQNVEMSEVANLARLYAHLIIDGAISLGVLKVLDLVAAKERTLMFVELMLIILFTEAKPDALAKVFERAGDTPQIVKRLQFFIKKTVRGSDLVGKRDRDAVKQGCQVALGTLRRMKGVNQGVDKARAQPWH